MPSAAARDVLQAMLERRAAEKRREMAAVQGFGSVRTSPAEPAPLVLPFARQVEDLAASELPPRNEPLPFAKTLTGAVGESLYGVPIAGPAALGLGARLGAAGRYVTGRQPYGEALEEIQTGQENFRRNSPFISSSAQNAGASIFAPAFGSSMGAQVVGNAAVAGADAAVRGDDPTVAGVAAGGIAGATHLPAIFAGVAAKTANREMLTLATDLKNGGFTPEEIWKKTGWFQGKDDKWRFEIPDQPSQFVPATTGEPLNRIQLAQQRFTEQTGLDPIKFATPKWSDQTTEALKWVDANMERLAAEAPKTPLGEVLHHPELYAAYPEMANIPTMPERLRHASLEGSFDPRTNMITYGGSEMMGGISDNRSTLLHEAQHAIQQREGFAKGGMPKEFELGQEDMADTQRFIREYGTALDLLREVNERKIGIDAATKEYKDLGLADERMLARAKDIISTFEPDAIKRIYDAHALNIELGKQGGREGYRRLAGEVEARNVAERADRTPEGMRDLPEYTEDVPRGQQIVRGVPPPLRVAPPIHKRGK